LGRCGIGDVLCVLFSAQKFSAGRGKRKAVPLRTALFIVERNPVVQGYHRMLPDTSEGLLVMKKSDITYIICSVFSAMTAFFYFFAMWLHIRLLRYYPLEHTWKWVKEEGVPSQGWYAKQVFAFLAAGVVTLVVYFILKRYILAETYLKPALTRILGLVVTLIVIICMGYMLYYEFDKWGVFTSLGWQ